MGLSLLLGKSVYITAQAGALWYYLGKHSPYEKENAWCSLSFVRRMYAGCGT